MKVVFLVTNNKRKCGFRNTPKGMADFNLRVVARVVATRRSVKVVCGLWHHGSLKCRRGAF